MTKLFKPVKAYIWNKELVTLLPQDQFLITLRLKSDKIILTILEWSLLLFLEAISIIKCYITFAVLKRGLGCCATDNFLHLALTSISHSVSYITFLFSKWPITLVTSVVF